MVFGERSEQFAQARFRFPAEVIEEPAPERGAHQLGDTFVVRLHVLHDLLDSISRKTVIEREGAARGCLVRSWAMLRIVLVARRIGAIGAHMRRQLLEINALFLVVRAEFFERARWGSELPRFPLLDDVGLDPRSLAYDEL